MNICVTPIQVKKKNTVSPLPALLPSSLQSQLSYSLDHLGDFFSLFFLIVLSPYYIGQTL